MSSRAQFGWLSDEKRMHFQHGPIDLIIEANGAPDEVRRAYKQAMSAFDNVLVDLVAELELLRLPIAGQVKEPQGTVAKKMMIAAAQHRHQGFVTPMIAVAGSVADHMLQALLHERVLERAYVNNGGDIALHLGAEQSFSIGVCDTADVPAEHRSMTTTVRLEADHKVGGIATSGWRGRSHSLGIADAVTVLATSAADADAAATLIANAVDLPQCASIIRTPAVELALDSDLGDRLVTVAVESLVPEQVEQALTNGARVAEDMLERQLIRAAFLSLQGQTLYRGDAHVDSLASPLRPRLRPRSRSQSAASSPAGPSHGAKSVPHTAHNQYNNYSA